MCINSADHQILLQLLQTHTIDAAFDLIQNEKEVKFCLFFERINGNVQITRSICANEKTVSEELCLPFVKEMICKGETEPKEITVLENKALLFPTKTESRSLAIILGWDSTFARPIASYLSFLYSLSFSTGCSPKLNHIHEIDSDPLSVAFNIAKRARGLSAKLDAVAQEARKMIGAHMCEALINFDVTGSQHIIALDMTPKYDAYKLFKAPRDLNGIYRDVCTSNSPIRLTQEELYSHPHFANFGKYKDKHPFLRGWLAVPFIDRQGVNMGLIQLSDKYEGDFTEEDQKRLIQFCQYASIFLETAAADAALKHQEEQIRKLNQELEERVLSRTSELQAANDRLRKQKEFVDSIVDSCSDGIIAFNMEHTITLFNPAMSRITGIPASIAIGSSFESLLSLSPVASSLYLSPVLPHPFPLDSFYAALRGDKTFELEFTGKEGTVEVSGFPSSEGGVCIVRDVTQYKRHAQLLETARDEAVTATSVKSQFLANMSHEIRTPLHAVIGMSECLRDTELDEKQKEYLQVIYSSANILLSLVNHILDYSKIEAGKMKLEKKIFNLEELVTSTINMFKVAATKKGLKIGIETANEQENKIDENYEGDQERIRQVLTNLLGNAIKFTFAGGVTVKITKTEETEKQIIFKIEVKDTGPGIHPKIITHLFQPFEQADPSVTRRYGGTGLGLAISKGITEIMGGNIGILHTSEKGSVFYFTVPLQKISENNNKPGDDSPPRAHPPFSPCLSSLLVDNNISIPISPRSPPSPPSLISLSSSFSSLSSSGEVDIPWDQDMKILVAEDNPVNVLVMQLQLKKLKINFDFVNNGLEAVSQIKKSRYSLVLMDCQMPELDGYSATTIIRALNHPCSKTPIIAMTAHAMEGDKEKCISVGMSDYLSKPISFESLKAMLLKWLFCTKA